MSIIVGSIIFCVMGLYILAWICSALMGDGGLYMAGILFAALIFALLVKLHMKQEEILEKQEEILRKLQAPEQEPEHTRK